MRLFDFFNPRKVIDKDYLHKPFYDIYKELRIFIDHTKITNDVNDFPLLIVLDDSKIDFNKLNSDASDIRFVDENGNLIPHYFEKIDLTNKQIIVHVKVPVVHASADIKIIMKYGDGKHYPISDFSVVFPDLLGYWTLDGTFNDLSGNYNLNSSGNIDFVDGFLGKCMQMKLASCDTYTVTNEKILRNNVQETSVIGWINQLGMCQADPSLCDFSESWNSIWHLTPNNENNNYSRQPGLWLTPGENKRFHVRNDASNESNYGIYESNIEIEYNSWNFIAQTIDLTTMKLYVNENLSNSIPILSEQTYLHNDGWFYIGDKWLYKNTQYSRIRFYNKILSQDEINLIYHMEKQDLLKFY